MVIVDNQRLTPVKSKRIDTQNDAMFEAGDTRVPRPIIFGIYVFYFEGVVRFPP